MARTPEEYAYGFLGHYCVCQVTDAPGTCIHCMLTKILTDQQVALCAHLEGKMTKLAQQVKDLEKKAYVASQEARRDLDDAVASAVDKIRDARTGSKLGGYEDWSRYLCSRCKEVIEKVTVFRDALK